MSTTKTMSDGIEITPAECPDALLRALREPMVVVPDDPDTAGDHEVMVYSGDSRYRVNIDVGHCGCPAFMYHHDSVEEDKHWWRAMLAMGERDIPEWVHLDAVDPTLLCRRAALEGQR